MTINKLEVIGVGVLMTIAIMLIVFFSFPKFSHANPAYFCPVKATATATTSPTYMTFGVGTTTLTYDSVQNCGSINTKSDSAMVFFQFDATSTISTPAVNMRIEYSQDNIDWYPASNEVIANATSTSVGSYATYVFPVATTTAATDFGGSGFVNSTTNPTATSTTMFSKIIAMPTRYVRVIFTMSSGNGKGGLWAQMLPIKQNN